MQYFQGRLLDHLHLRVSDLSRSRRFYQAIFQALGKTHGFGEGADCFFNDELYVEQALPATSGLHIAFQAENKQQVQDFYRSALAAGGEANGAPGLRDYHANYYAAFVLDPDGNNIEAVCDIGSSRSSPAVIVTRCY